MAAVPHGFDLEQIADQPAVVEHAVGEFVHSFVEALAIVLFVSFLALGWRTGIVVALSVPLVLADRVHRHECAWASTCTASRSAR